MGSNRTIKVNVRIIAATNRNLEQAVQSGAFRSDLYYRLNVIPLRVPALRERRSDIPQIVMAFLQQSAKRMGKPVPSVSPETMRSLVEYSWPGNIRELQNVIERAVVLSKGPILELGADLPPVEPSGESVEPEDRSESESSDSLHDVKRQYILRVLDKTGWVISGPGGAGAILDVHPNTLRSLMNRLGIRRAASGCVVSALGRVTLFRKRPEAILCVYEIPSPVCCRSRVSARIAAKCFTLPAHFPQRLLDPGACIVDTRAAVIAKRRNHK